jgi:hypothetical protein
MIKEFYNIERPLYSPINDDNIVLSPHIEDISNENIEMETDGKLLNISITHALVKMKFSFVSNSEDEGRYVCVGINEV